MRLDLLKPRGLAVGLLWSSYPTGTQDLTLEEAPAIAEGAYVYGRALISVELSRKTAPSVLYGTLWPPAIAKAAV